MRMMIDRLTDREVAEVKRRQRERFNSDIKIRSAPAPRRARNGSLTVGQIEQLRHALLNAFRW